MSDIANRDEALKCAEIAKAALAAGDVPRAEKFAAKALRLFRCPEVSPKRCAHPRKGGDCARAHRLRRGGANRQASPGLPARRVAAVAPATLRRAQPPAPTPACNRPTPDAD